MTNAEWCDSFEHRVATNMREMRERHNMTLSALSARTGISWKTLENWELEKCSPSLSKFWLMCRKMKWNPSELIGGVKNASS